LLNAPGVEVINVVVISLLVVALVVTDDVIASVVDVVCCVLLMLDVMVDDSVSVDTSVVVIARAVSCTPQKCYQFLEEVKLGVYIFKTQCRNKNK